MERVARRLERVARRLGPVESNSVRRRLRSRVNIPSVLRRATRSRRTQGQLHQATPDSGAVTRSCCRRRRGSVGSIGPFDRVGGSSGFSLPARLHRRRCFAPNRAGTTSDDACFGASRGRSRRLGGSSEGHRRRLLDGSLHIRGPSSGSGCQHVTSFGSSAECSQSPVRFPSVPG